MDNPTPFADIKPNSLNFQRAYGEFKNVRYRYFIYNKHRGLREIIVRDDLSKISYQCMYVHFQKRKMKIYAEEAEASKAIFPNEIVNGDIYIKKSNILQSNIYSLEKWLALHTKKESLNSIKHKIEFKKFVARQKSFL